MKPLKYSHTELACYLGYITQAAVNNLPPLLFLTFQRSFSVSIEAITALITLNFGTQLVTDLVFSKLTDKIRLPRQRGDGTCFGVFGIGVLRRFAVCFAKSLHRACHCDAGERGRRRPGRGVNQPHRRVSARHAEIGQDEFAARHVLLGTGGRDSDFNPVFCHRRHCKMAVFILCMVTFAAV